VHILLLYEILPRSEEVKVGSVEIGRPHLDATAQVEAAVILEASKSKVKRECADLVPPVLGCNARVFDLCKKYTIGPKLRPAALMRSLRFFPYTSHQALSYPCNHMPEFCAHLYVVFWDKSNLHTPIG